MLKNILVLHPFFLAAWPPLFILSNNIEKVPLGSILAIILCLLFCTFCLWLLCSWLLHSKMKGGVIVFLFQSWILFYNIFFESVKGLDWGGILISRHKFVFSAWSIIFIFIASIVVRRHGDFRKLTAILNVFSGMLIISCLFNLIVGQLKYKESITSFSERSQNIVSEEMKMVPSGKLESLPDIYYIILDSYCAYNSLKENYKFDNYKFYSSLKKSGFYISEKSFSNYNETRFSLTSSLNMGYLQDLYSEEKFKNLSLAGVRDSRVARILRSKGYKIIELTLNKCGQSSLLCNGSGDGKNIVFSNEFSKYLVVKYFLSMTFLKYIAYLGDITTQESYRKCILFLFDTLMDVSGEKGPKFVFVHILPPHAPFAFGPNGEKNTLFFSLRTGLRELYVRQLIYVNKRVEEAVGAILSKSGVAPIIILQADHGSVIATPNSNIFDPRRLREHFAIFSAYYLPGEKKKIVYDSITPVNIFRAVLIQYFNSKDNLLPDKNYLFYKNNFIDITDKILTN